MSDFVDTGMLEDAIEEINRLVNHDVASGADELLHRHWGAIYERVKAYPKLAEDVGEWISVEDELPPEDNHRPLLVTNALPARNAHGEMSHIWLVNMIHEENEEDAKRYGKYTAFHENRRIEVVSHWRYALPSPEDS